MCPMDSEAKLYQNIRVWKKVLLRAVEGDGCFMPLRPQTPCKLSAKPFPRKGEGGA